MCWKLLVFTCNVWKRWSVCVSEGERESVYSELLVLFMRSAGLEECECLLSRLTSLGKREGRRPADAHAHTHSSVPFQINTYSRGSPSPLSAGKEVLLLWWMLVLLARHPSPLLRLFPSINAHCACLPDYSPQCFDGIRPVKGRLTLSLQAETGRKVFSEPAASQSRKFVT